MSRVSLNHPAPNFSLPDFSGKVFSLADLRGQKSASLPACGASTWSWETVLCWLIWTGTLAPV
jgi:hypothetical protein